MDPERIRGLPDFSPVDWSYEGRPNVVGVHEPGATRGRSLLVNGHVFATTRFGAEQTVDRCGTNAMQLVPHGIVEL